MLDPIAVILVYSGLAGSCVAACSMIKPWRFVGIRSRRVAVVVLALSVLDAAAGFLMPAPVERTSEARTDLDRFMPAWQFGERHQVTVHAAPTRVYEAIQQVTANEIALFRTLTWIRSPHIGAANESILNPGNDPIIDVAERSGFTRLSERSPHEIVLGTLLAPHVKATINFLVAPGVDGTTHLATETRVFAENPRTARLFAVYWRLIYPGSALIRVMWLRAIRARALRQAGQVTLLWRPVPALPGRLAPVCT
jgi:hypothetical protein